MKTLVDNGKVRVRAVEAQALLQDGTEDERYQGGKWGGLYLRAPEIYFRVLEMAGDKLVRLKDVAEVRFGIKTGANDFFYLEPLPYRPVCPQCGRVHEEALTAEEERAWRERGEEPPEGTLVAVKNGMGWEGYLEYNCLLPVIRSPRELPSSSLEVRVADLTTRVFLAPKLLGKHSQSYVGWGEQVEVEISQGSRKGRYVKGYHNLPSVSANQPWWKIANPVRPPNLVCMMSYNNRFGFWLNRRALVDNRLYTIQVKPGIKIEALSMVLNWSFVFLQQYLLGRSNLGQGALDFKVYEAEQLLVMDPRNLQCTEEKIAKLGAFQIEEKILPCNCLLEPSIEKEIRETTQLLHRERIKRAAS